MVAPASRNDMVTSRPNPPVPPVTITILSWKFMVPSHSVPAEFSAPGEPCSAHLQMDICLNLKCSPQGERYMKLTPLFAREASTPSPSIQSDGSRPIPLRYPRENIRKTKSNRATTDRFEIYRSRHTPAGVHFRRAEKCGSAIGRVPHSPPTATSARPSRPGTPRE